MSRWYSAARVDSIPSGQGRTVRIADRDVALFNDQGRFYAIDDTCPHQGASLGEGTLHEGRVICPWHSWIFKLEDGSCAGMPELRVGCYRTRTAGGEVEVEIPEAS